MIPETPEITNTESSSRPNFRVRVAQAAEFLKREYPNLFARAPVPLKIGVHQDLMTRHPEMDVPALKRALTLRCRSRSYLKAHTAGAPRIDLDGGPCGEVTAEQAEIAKAKLAEILSKAKARQKPTQRPKKPAQRPEPVVSPPPEPPPPPSDALGRPVLRLKKKPSSSVVVATVVRKGAKP